MSSADGPDGPSLPKSPTAGDQRPRGVDSHLLEALMFVLIEKGVLSRNDALSVVGTVAEVKQGQADGDAGATVQAAADLILLQRLYASFEALDDRLGTVNFDGENVHRLRPPLHCDRPTFPRDD